MKDLTEDRVVECFCCKGREKEAEREKGLVKEWEYSGTAAICLILSLAFVMVVGISLLALVVVKTL